MTKFFRAEWVRFPIRDHAKMLFDIKLTIFLGFSQNTVMEKVIEDNLHDNFFHYRIYWKPSEKILGLFQISRQNGIPAYLQIENRTPFCLSPYQKSLIF